MSDNEDSKPAQSPPRVYGADVQFKANKLLDLYIKCFEERFGQKPLITLNDAGEILRWAVIQLTYEKACVLLQAYFSIDDEWVKNKAYPLSWFKNNINEVIAKSTKAGRLTMPVYVVFLTESGTPVCSHNAAEMRNSPYAWFRPILFEEWKKLPIEEKLQKSQKDWEQTGNPVNQWILNWTKWGFLKDENAVQ